MLLKIPRYLTKLFIPAIVGLILCLTMTAVEVNGTIRPVDSREIGGVTSFQVAAHGNWETINSIARTTTVFIIPDELSQENFGAALDRGQKFINAGSGMLVARRGSTYYVLTNEHVARYRGAYVIRTYDGELHQINNYRPAYPNLDQPDTTDQIITRFGEFDPQRKVVDGYDLALIQFESNKDYPIVPIGDSSGLGEGDFVFVSGWPYDQEADRVRILREGQLKQILNPADPNGNYSLCYTAETASGMSGGPVFNEQGEMIGIHGRGRTYDSSHANCIDTSWGIQVSDFIREQEKIEHYRLSKHFKRPPVNPSEFAQINVPNADSLRNELNKFNDLIIDPRDPAFQAVKNLVDRYDGCMKPLADGTWRLARTATRGEFVIDINSCLDTIMNLASESKTETVSRSDFESVEQTVAELAREVESLLSD